MPFVDHCLLLPNNVIILPTKSLQQNLKYANEAYTQISSSSIDHFQWIPFQSMIFAFSWICYTIA